MATQVLKVLMCLMVLFAAQGCIPMGGGYMVSAPSYRGGYAPRQYYQAPVYVAPQANWGGGGSYYRPAPVYQGGGYTRPYYQAPVYNSAPCPQYRGGWGGGHGGYGGYRGGGYRR